MIAMSLPFETLFPIAMGVVIAFAAVVSYLELRDRRKAEAQKISTAVATAEAKALKEKYADRYLTMQDAVTICAGLKQIKERYGNPVTIEFAAQSDKPSKVTLSS
jgi:hypothetical protein